MKRQDQFSCRMEIAEVAELQPASPNQPFFGERKSDLPEFLEQSGLMEKGSG